MLAKILTLKVLIGVGAIVLVLTGSYLVWDQSPEKDLVNSEPVVVKDAEKETKSFVASIVETVEEIIPTQDDGFELVEEIDLDVPDLEEDLLGDLLGSMDESTDSVFDDFAVFDEIEEVREFCEFETGDIPTEEGLVFSEIAWMGTLEGPTKEWIELQALEKVDVRGWSILDKENQIKVWLDGEIDIYDFYILYRSVDYSGALSNQNEELRLFDADCNLIDVVSANPSWAAGSREYKTTMERSEDLSWHSSSVQGGTPGAVNTPAPVYKADTGSGGTEDPPAEETGTTTEEESTPPVTYDILISEVLFNPDGPDDGQEFVELYNNGSADVDMKDWSLKKVTSSGTEYSLGKIGFKPIDITLIKSGGFLLIGLKNNFGGDVIRSPSLPNIATIQLRDSAGILVDETSYDGATMNEGESWERINNTGNFQAQAIPSPTNAN